MSIVLCWHLVVTIGSHCVASYYKQQATIKLRMTQIASLAEQDQFNLRQNLRERNAQMLAFLYHAQYSFAAQHFDTHFDIHLQLKKLRKSEAIDTEELSRAFLSLSHKLHERIIREDSETDRALNKLETLWESRKIEVFHRYFVQRQLMSSYVRSVGQLIRHEDQLIRNEQHVYFAIHRAIWAREAALNQLARSIGKLGPEDVHEHFHTLRQREVQAARKVEQRQYRVHGYPALYRLDWQEANLGTTKMEVLSQDLQNYRKITMYVVRLIASWKDYMHSLTPDPKKERLQFYYHDRNYLLTLLTDASFVGSSFLANFYTFANRNDPLLLRPVLAIEKKEAEQSTLSFEQHQLKQIVQIKDQELTNITFTIQQLYNEVEVIIRNRKVLDTHTFNKLKRMSLDQPQKPTSLALTKSNKLQPLQTTKSGILRAANLGDRQTSQNSLTKSNVVIRQLAQIQRKSATKSFYRSTQKSQTNPESTDPYKMLQSEELLKLKQQVFEKVKVELQSQAKKTIMQSRQFEELVDFEVKAKLTQMLELQRRELEAFKLEITPLSIFEQEIGSFLHRISKDIPISCLQMQQDTQQLSSQMSEGQFLYVLKVHTASQTVGHVVGRVSKESKDYKLVEMMYVSFGKVEYLQKIMQKVVQFMWKYQSCRELTFKFMAVDPASETRLKQLRDGLTQYCTVLAKKRKDCIEYVFTFSKKGNNEQYVYNPYPLQLHIKLYAALTTQPLKLDSTLQHQAALLHYEYLVMEMLKLYTNSQDFIVLRDTFRPKERFRHLLKLMLEVENNKANEIEITAFSAENVTQLQEQLIHYKKPLLQVSDLVKVNNIKALLCELTVSPAYKLKVLSNREGVKMHRYSINSVLDCFLDDQGTQFLLLEVHQSHHQKIMVYNAAQYVKREGRKLNTYLFEKLQKSRKAKKAVANLWMEMARYPQAPIKQQEHYLGTFASSSQFSSIDKHLFIGDYCDWFTDLRIQNGISYQLEKEDMVIRKPFGVSVVADGVNVIYSRVFQ